MAASTSDAEARRSEHITAAEDSCDLPPDGRRAAFDADVGTHADEFLDMHEAVLEDVFGDLRRAFALGGEGHILRLHIGREAWIFLG